MKVSYSFYKYHKFLIMIAGNWHLKLENHFLNFIYSSYAKCLYCFSFVMVQDILISIWMFRMCPYRILELACYYVQYTNVLLMGYISTMPKMKKALSYISDKEKVDISESDAETYKTYAVINRRVICTITSLTVTAAIPWYIFAFKGSFAQEINPDCPLGRGLCFQLWYPFNLYHNLYWITKLADTLLFYSMFFSLTYTRVITVFFMVYVLGQIKIIQNMIRRIDCTSAILMKKNNIDYNAAIFKAVTQCAKQHYEIQRLMRLVNKACREFVLIGFFSNSMEMALFLMQVLMAETIVDVFKQTAVLFMTVAQLFLFLWYANEINVESVAIANVIYNETEWINYDTRARKVILMIMTRSQKPMTCNSIFIGDMTIDTFKNMIKLCYSITTFFKTAYL